MSLVKPTYSFHFVDLEEWVGRYYTAALLQMYI